MSKTETVSPVEILRDYDREMTVKARAMLADEIERLNGKLAAALYRIEVLRASEAKLVGHNLALIEDCKRLDWLERWIADNSSGFEIYPIGPDEEYGEDGNTVVNVRGWNLADKLWTVKTLREAIDAAMAAETVGVTK